VETLGDNDSFRFKNGRSFILQNNFWDGLSKPDFKRSSLWTTAAGRARRRFRIRPVHETGHALAPSPLRPAGALPDAHRRRLLVYGGQLDAENTPYRLTDLPPSMSALPFSMSGKLQVMYGKSFSSNGKLQVMYGKSFSINGKPFSIAGKRQVIHGKPFSINGKSFCIHDS
jgi:hypothetical protein